MGSGHSDTGGQAAGGAGQKAGAMSTSKPIQPKFRTWRIVVPVLLAIFGALLCAGPGSVAVPSTLRLFERVACPAGQYAALPTVAAANARVQAVYCVDAAGAPTEATGQFFFAGLSLYSLLLLVPLLALGLTLRLGAPKATRPLGADADNELRRMIAAGRHLEAVKLVQNRLGTSRRWARDYVQELAKAPDVPAPNPATAEARPPSLSVIERLQQLKELLETNLISEEEYAAKRFDILEAL